MKERKALDERGVGELDQQRLPERLKSYKLGETLRNAQWNIHIHLWCEEMRKKCREEGKDFGMEYLIYCSIGAAEEMKRLCENPEAYRDYVERKRQQAIERKREYAEEVEKEEAGRRRAMKKSKEVRYIG